MAHTGNKASHGIRDTVKISIPSDPKLLKIVRSSVLHLCELIGFEEDERKSTMLAVDEACTNIIKHAYREQTDQPIEITMHMLADGLEVVLRDFGISAEAGEIKSRELDELRPGGLGVHLIQSVMDFFEYDNTPEQGNELTLRKYIRRK